MSAAIRDIDLVDKAENVIRALRTLPADAKARILVAAAVLFGVERQAAQIFALARDLVDLAEATAEEMTPAQQRAEPARHACRTCSTTFDDAEDAALCCEPRP